MAEIALPYLKKTLDVVFWLFRAYRNVWIVLWIIFWVTFAYDLSTGAYQ